MGRLGGRKAGNQATCRCHSMLCRYGEQIKRKTKPCRLLGGFSGEAGETTIATGDEAVASESPVGKDSPQRRAMLRHSNHNAQEGTSDSEPKTPAPKARSLK